MKIEGRGDDDYMKLALEEAKLAVIKLLVVVTTKLNY